MNENNQNNSILNFFSSESAEMAEFRRTYAKLRHLNKDKELKSFLITSAELGEGKSTVSSLFAITISKYHNTKTLLIDVDLRRPRVHKLFKIEQENGVAEILLGKINLKNGLKRSVEKNLDILTSGKLTEAPATLFNSEAALELFDECKYYYDTIIMDSSPIIPVSDSIVIGSELDGVILVVKAGDTKKNVVKRAKNMLVDSGVNLLGVILNNCGEVLPYYYDHKYYGYKYYSQDIYNLNNS